MKTYLEISITATPHQQELLLPTMIELGCQGFQESDGELLCYIDKSRWSSDKYEQFRSDLKRTLRIISANASVRIKEIQEENWNVLWEQTIQPIEIGQKLVVKPSWCDYNNIENRIIIQIDPKMSFGTGYHETTRLILQLLERYVDAEYSILDVGMGTGILAIAGVKLGTTTAVGIDVDDWSIENARENVESNCVADKVAIFKKPIDELESPPADLITANLTLNSIIELLQHFRSHLRDGGLLLLSGLLQSDRQAMTKHLRDHHFEVIEQLTENEWIALAAQKLT
ncbi:MAG: 50S ribosomal protein L11 methyltransferase [Ignavibacteriae bacterium]|nr:50S ribosomal protein L11 methyltransferase [Ignavibacteriota bacterium]